MKIFRWQVFASSEAHYEKTSILPLVCIMTQNKATSDDDIVSVLHCVDESLSGVESSDSDNEIRGNQELNHKSVAR